MASRGRGRRGRLWGIGPPPPVFDPQDFMETMGSAVATIVQAGVAMGQGGISNLHRFRAHHPSTFPGGGGIHW